MLVLCRFYRDALMLENFAIMNYCAFSKILKKHDKVRDPTYLSHHPLPQYLSLPHMILSRF